MRLFNFETKQVIHEDDPIKARELIDGGKAQELSLPELERFEQKASDLYKTYQSQVDRIKKSDNPIYTEEIREYELNRLKEEYEKQAEEVEREYAEYRATRREEARKQAAQATIKVTDDDRLVADQFATRASLNLATAHDKAVVLKQIAEDIALLTDEQKTALQREIGGVLASVSEEHMSDKRAVISAVQDVRNSDLLAYEVAKQLPVSVKPVMARIREVAQKVVSEASAMSDGSIDREFYEKHLKGKGDNQ